MKANKKGSSASKPPAAKGRKSSNSVAGPKKKPSATEKKPKKADSSVSAPKRKGSQASFVSKNDAEGEERHDPDSPPIQLDEHGTPQQELVSPS